jgi:hypothetical protein
VIGQPVQELGIRVVGQRVFAVRAGFAGVEVRVGKVQAAGIQRVERLLEVLSRAGEAVVDETFGLRRRAPNLAVAAAADLRQQQSSARTRQQLGL